MGQEQEKKSSIVIVRGRTDFSQGYLSPEGDLSKSGFIATNIAPLDPEASPETIVVNPDGTVKVITDRLVPLEQQRIYPKPQEKQILPYDYSKEKQTYTPIRQHAP